jgi:hypothetical protein
LLGCLVSLDEVLEAEALGDRVPQSARLDGLVQHGGGAAVGVGRFAAADGGDQGRVSAPGECNRRARLLRLEIVIDIGCPYWCRAAPSLRPVRPPASAVGDDSLRLAMTALSGRLGSRVHGDQGQAHPRPIHGSDEGS